MTSQFYVRQNNGIWNASTLANPATGVGGFSLAAMPGPYLPAFSGGTGGGGSFLQDTIAPGTKTLTIPQSAGVLGAGNVSFSGTAVMYCRWIPTASGTMTGLQVSPNASGYNNSVTLGIYSDSAGSPHTLLGSTAPTAFATAGINSISFISSVAITSGTTYWLAMTTNSTSTPLWNTCSSGGSGTYDFQTGTTPPVLPPTAAIGGSFNYNMWYGILGTFTTTFTSSLIEPPPSGSSNWSSVMAWDPATIAGTMTISASTLVSNLGGTTSGGVKGTINQGVVGGLFYFEHQLSINPQNVFVGISTVGATLPTATITTGTACISNDGHIYVNGTSVASGLTLGNSDIIGIALFTPSVGGALSEFFF